MLDFECLGNRQNIKNYDVVVCGGGPAGFSAAVCSARAGARTIIIERNSCLGGIWTAGLLTWILDIKNKSDKGLLKEMFTELSEIGAGRFIADGVKFSCDVEEMKHYLEQKCVAEGIDVLFGASVCGVKSEERRIKYIAVNSKSGIEYFSAKAYIDATGDGDLGAMSGCSFRSGDAEGNTQPMSLIALLCGVDVEKVRLMNNSETIAGNNPKKNLFAEMQRAGITPSYTQPTLMQLSDDGIFALMSNHEYGIKAYENDKITKSVINARHELYNTVKALKKLGGAWKNVHLVATAEQIGVREGRQIEGVYSITEHDVFEGSCFDDAICDVQNRVDIHSPKCENGGGVVDVGRISKPYQIPLRALIAKDNDSVIMAGRCISGEMYAHSTFRLTGNAVETGSAAGILAALSAASGDIPKGVSFSDFKKMQNRIFG
ncbi:MAG: FAD-dependent oxidoreductase [Clostridia bacterium]|nr:FAD-dependent oxidoreductase [Clostridia bacterium]